jgi:hypothetical protein
VAGCELACVAIPTLLQLHASMRSREEFSTQFSCLNCMFFTTLWSAGPTRMTKPAKALTTSPREAAAAGNLPASTHAAAAQAAAAASAAAAAARRRQRQQAAAVAVMPWLPPVHALSD